MIFRWYSELYLCTRLFLDRLENKFYISENLQKTAHRIRKLEEIQYTSALSLTFPGSHSTGVYCRLINPISKFLCQSSSGVVGVVVLDFNFLDFFKYFGACETFSNTLLPSFVCHRIILYLAIKIMLSFILTSIQRHLYVMDARWTSIPGDY